MTNNYCGYKEVYISEEGLAHFYETSFKSGGNPYYLLKNEYLILKDISLQNSKLDFDIDSETREVTLSAIMKDFGIISDDGEWPEINDYLKGVE